MGTISSLPRVRCYALPGFRY